MSAMTISAYFENVKDFKWLLQPQIGKVFTLSVSSRDYLKEYNDEDSNNEMASAIKAP